MQRIRIVALFAAAIVIGGCSASGALPSSTSSTPAPSADQPPAGNVVIHAFAFGPQKISVTAGSTVTWTNQDAILHTVTPGTVAQPEDLQPEDGRRPTWLSNSRQVQMYGHQCSEGGVTLRRPDLTEAGDEPGI